MIQNDRQLKRELPFDLFGRYAVIRDIINVNRKENMKFRVLDVGGRGNLMRRFLPEDDVFYLDPLVDTKDANYVEGDGCAMPLEDESFDWVVSADVFEHIPKEKREDFLNENIRVAKLGMILAAPFDSAEVRQAESNANENFKILSGGKDHIWLKEHIANGLPQEKELEKFVKSKDLEFQKLFNNGIFVWESLLCMNFFVGNNLYEDIKKELENFNYFYNTEIFPHDSAEPSYRKIYFIKKDVKLDNIEVKNKPIDDLLFLNTIKRAMDLIGKVDIENKRIIQEKDEELRKKSDSCKFEVEEAMLPLKKKIEESEELIKERDVKIQQKDSEIQQKESKIQQKELVIQQKDSEIQQKEKIVKDRNAEIKMMKSSKFWKMRNKYINLKSKLGMK